MVHKCLFPVAGYGTRFLPATKSIPKEMLPILDKPLLHYGVEEAWRTGINDMVMVTGRGKSAVQEYFDVSYELEHQIAGSERERSLYGIRNLLDHCTFSYTRQRAMKGLGDAIFSGRHLIGQAPFAVLLADDLCFTPDNSPAVLAKLVELHLEYGCTVVALAEIPEASFHRYGVIEGKPLTDRVWQIKNMVEKPTTEEAPSNLAIVGRYVLTPDIFALIESTPAGYKGEVQITDAIKRQISTSGVVGYRFEGHWFDCGSIEGFVDATNYVYQHQYLQ